MSLTPKRPSVSVPVLSKTAALRLRARSKAARSRIKRPLLAESDVLLALGSSLTRTPYGQKIPAGKTIIHNTNNPDELNKDEAATIGLVGDTALTIEALIACIEAKTGGKGDDCQRDRFQHVVSFAVSAQPVHGCRPASARSACSVSPLPGRETRKPWFQFRARCGFAANAARLLQGALPLAAVRPRPARR